MRKSIHAVFSFAGNKNFGDDYILSEWIKYSESRDSGRKFLVSTDSTWLQSHHFSDNAVFNTIFPATTHPFVRDWKNSNPDRKMSISECIVAGWKAADHFSKQRVWKKVLDDIAAFHVCGGGYLNTLFPQAHATVAMMQRLASHLGVPLYGTGLGLMPTEDGNSALAQLLEGFEVIECRDRNSFDFLISKYPAVNAMAGTDDTFLTPVRSAVQPNRKPALFVNVQSDLSAVFEPTLKRVVEIIEHIGDDYEVQYVHFFQDSDTKFLEQLRKKANVRQWYDKDQLYDGGLPFQDGDLCISSRFHMHLLASRLGARGAYISGRTGYYDIKHQSVVDIGSNWLDFSASDFSPSSLLAASIPNIDESGLREQKGQLARTVLA